MTLRLFLFHDGIEEILVAARDPEDAFTVVDEAFGKGAGDDLITSFMGEYGSEVASVIAKRRRVVLRDKPGRFRKDTLTKVRDDG